MALNRHPAFPSAKADAVRLRVPNKELSLSGQLPHSRLMSRWPIILALGGLSGCVSAQPDTGMIGQYRLAEGPDAAGELILTADGRFSYALAVGALDERAQGRWEQNGSAICLFTEPTPVSALFSRDSTSRGEEGSRLLIVIWPSGDGIAGVDFRLGFDDGSIIDGYTQHDGWSMSPEDRRKPRWIELAVPMHGLNSPRFALDEQDRGPWRFVLTPNDLGVVDFQGACLRREESGYMLERGAAKMRFVRTDP